ncbi:hypothetical protein EYF80_023097 [Liparis tanakae]|uniref:Uncharacterized protein n=1 Tax=Liparis tanakae TaxID=230148 RepID=A0A4Z2HLH6_9TELE|nr:hypothetical protein EYF80_023097 [Liparis tanakae]
MTSGEKCQKRVQQKKCATLGFLPGQPYNTQTMADIGNYSGCPLSKTNPDTLEVGSHFWAEQWLCERPARETQDLPAEWGNTHRKGSDSRLDG